MTFFARFPATPTVSFASVSTAFANTNGTGNSSQLVQISQGVANGGQVSSVKVQATGNTTQGLVNFFLSLDSGATKFLIAQFPIPTQLADSLSPAFASVVSDLKETELSSNASILYAAVSTAQAAALVFQTTFIGYANNVA